MFEFLYRYKRTTDLMLKKVCINAKKKTNHINSILLLTMHLQISFNIIILKN